MNPLVEFNFGQIAMVTFNPANTYFLCVCTRAGGEGCDPSGGLKVTLVGLNSA